MSDDANPSAAPAAPEPAAPAEAPAEPASPPPTIVEVPVAPSPASAQSAEVPAPTVEMPTAAESTHLPANESISQTPPESISEPPEAPEPAAPQSSVKPTVSQSPVSPTPQRNPREMLVGANVARRAKLQTNLDTIMAELGKTGTISHNGVQKMLKCSNATAIRYLSLLVKLGKIKGEGKGRGVVYVRV